MSVPQRTKWLTKSCLSFEESPYVTDITPENFLFQLICEFTGYIEQIEAELQKIFQNKCVDLPVQLVNLSEVVNGSGTAFKIAMNPISIPRSEQSPQGYIENSFHTEVIFGFTHKWHTSYDFHEFIFVTVIHLFSLTFALFLKCNTGRNFVRTFVSDAQTSSIKNKQ